MEAIHDNPGMAKVGAPLKAQKLTGGRGYGVNRVVLLN